jgi:hypothetical protein
VKIPNIGGLVSVCRSFVLANRPELLLGMSVTGTIVSVVAAARGGYKSGQEVLKVELTEDRQLTTKEKAQLTWLNYLPAAAGTLGSISATTGLHMVHVKEKKMLAAACLMAIDEVKKEGENYKKELKNLGFTMSDDPDELEAVADEDGVARYVYGDGIVEERYLIRDNKTGRDRWGTKLEIENALNEVNALLAAEGQCSLDTFYTYAGFDTIPEGVELGWSGKPGVSVRWETTVRGDDRPVRGFTFRPAPKVGYMDRRATTTP